MYRACVAALLAGCSFHSGLPAGAHPGDASSEPPSDSRDIDAAPPPAADAAIDATPDAPPPPPPTIPRDCEDAHAQGVTADGPQMIDPDGPGGNAPFTAYCDMTTDGGGWTLVWVYGFTDYGNFSSGTNAVTPRPTWGIPAGTTNVTPTSTTVPADPDTTGALDFARWASLGADVLVTSDINHWVACTPGTGSVVTLTSGSMSCQLVKAQPGVPVQCTSTVPDRFANLSAYNGVGLSRGSSTGTYYFWEGSTSSQNGNWPTHDPCGANGTNQLKNVPNPHGRLYLRRP